MPAIKAKAIAAREDFKLTRPAKANMTLWPPKAAKEVRGEA
jgi:hypothetical protein